jgi:hypothetical protein
MKKAETVIELKPIKVESFAVTLVGDTPLICHRWSEKIKRQILDKQMLKAKKGKEARSPVSEFAESLYWLTPMPAIEDEAGFEAAIKAGAKFGFPAIAFKAAAVSAGYRCGMLPNKVSANASFHIDGEFVEIRGIPEMREDMVRLAGPGGAADLRYRAEFKMWEASFEVNYDSSVTSPEIIVNLLGAAGFGVGIGEWRVEKGGEYGRFSVKTN